jgi:hypothetical protein
MPSLLIPSSPRGTDFDHGDAESPDRLVSYDVAKLRAHDVEDWWTKLLGIEHSQRRSSSSGRLHEPARKRSCAHQWLGDFGCAL